MKRVGVGGLLLLLMMPLADLLSRRSLGLTLVILVLIIVIGALGYRWLMEKFPTRTK